MIAARRRLFFRRSTQRQQQQDYKSQKILATLKRLSEQRMRAKAVRSLITSLEVPQFCWCRNEKGRLAWRLARARFQLALAHQSCAIYQSILSALLLRKQQAK
jgi:hypothetical protein